ncbi:MAG: Uma2 family endonuclease [Armatimonadota bacterium]
MAVVVPKKSYTIDDLWELSHRTGKRYELVQGELRELAPANIQHGFVAGRILFKLAAFVEALRVGYVLAAETGFVLSEDDGATVRAPDVAFISRERMPLPLPDRFATVVPDLVVEVLSPGDTFTLVTEKVNDWLRAGVKIVWVVDPSVKRVSIHKPNEPVRILSEDDTLSGEEVLHGFECKVSEIFAL